MKPSLIVLAHHPLSVRHNSRMMAPTILGAYPPIMARFSPEGEWYRDGFSWNYLYDTVEIGLPIWWQGEVVFEGWCRIRRLLAERGEHFPENPSFEQVLAAGHRAVALGIAARLDTQD